MEKHRNLTDEEFEEQFATCKLDPTIFSHEAHLRLAWIHLTKYGLDQALANIQEQLIQFVDHVGERDKYNATVTVAAVKMVNHFVERSKSNDFYSVIEEFPRMKENFRGLMQAHYSFDIFNLDKAKKDFIEPDKEPF